MSGLTRSLVLGGSGDETITPSGDTSGAADLATLKAAFLASDRVVLRPGAVYTVNNPITLSPGKSLFLNGATITRPAEVSTACTVPAIAHGSSGNPIILVADTTGFAASDEVHIQTATDNISSHVRIAAIVPNVSIQLYGTVNTSSTTTISGAGTITKVYSLIATNISVPGADRAPIFIEGPGVVDGNSAANTAVQRWEKNTVIFDTGHNVTCRNFTVQNSPGDGIQNNGGDDHKYLNLTLIDIRGNGIHMGGFGTKRALYSNCSFTRTNQNVTRSNEGALVGNYNGYDHVSGAICYSNNNNDVRVEGCSMTDCGALGIGFINGMVVPSLDPVVGNVRATITGTQMDRCAWGAVGVGNSSPFSADPKAAELDTTTTADINDGDMSLTLASTANMSAGDRIMVRGSWTRAVIDVVTDATHVALRYPIRCSATLLSGAPVNRAPQGVDVTITGNIFRDCGGVGNDSVSTLLIRGINLTTAESVLMTGNILINTPVVVNSAANVRLRSNSHDVRGLKWNSISGSTVHKAAISCLTSSDIIIDDDIRCATPAADLLKATNQNEMYGVYINGCSNVRLGAGTRISGGIYNVYTEGATNGIQFVDGGEYIDGYDTALRFNTTSGAKDITIGAVVIRQTASAKQYSDGSWNGIAGFFIAPSSRMRIFGADIRSERATGISYGIIFSTDIPVDIANVRVRLANGANNRCIYLSTGSNANILNCRLSHTVTTSLGSAVTANVLTSS